MPDISAAAFNGTSCYFVTDTGLIALDKLGKPLWTFKPRGWNASWRVFPSLDKLALYDGSRTVYWVIPTPQK
jgi:hypothetical protein